jgi:hypothetical protein
LGSIYLNLDLELGGRFVLRAAERCMTVAQEVGGVAL